jgi:hypothetical protein
MFFGFDSKDKKNCPKCGYGCMPPYPLTCPKCNHPLDFKKDSGEKNQKKDNIEEDKARKDFAKNILIKAKPDMVVSGELEGKPREVKEIEIVKTKTTDIDNRVKVKVKEKYDVDLSKDLIVLGPGGEYIKFFGVITQDHQELFASNDKYRYFLELSANLGYIASSILMGELDRMLLSGGTEAQSEYAFFLVNKGIIYIVYGSLAEKKASWLLNQMKNTMSELTVGINFETAEKLAFYNLSQNFGKKAKYLLEEYIKLQEVFTTKPLVSLDNFFRIDYFGLSYQSIGVMSKLLTDVLPINDIPPVFPDESDPIAALKELKESLITAKVEAMAANTVANTGVMPIWISVKISFQHYRFLIFDKLRDYYITLLAEGNLDSLAQHLDPLHKILDHVTQHPFLGDLTEFKSLDRDIKLLFEGSS